MCWFTMGSAPSRSGSLKSIRQSRENSVEIVNSRTGSLPSSRPTSTYSKHGIRPSSLKGTRGTSAGHTKEGGRVDSARRGGSVPGPRVMYHRPFNTSCELPGGVDNSSSYEQHHHPVQVNQMTLELEKLRNQLAETEMKAESFKEEAQELQELVLQKEDEICSMSLELEELKESGVKKQEERYQQTISAKDQYIRKLEEDLIRIKEEAAKECLIWEKKAKKAKKISATHRQDSALKLFELKDENTKLVAERAKLQERLDRANIGEGQWGSQDMITKDKVENSDEEDGKTHLILNLSQQVSALDEENMKLKKELKDCKRTIEKLHKGRIREKHSSRNDPLPGIGELQTSASSEKKVVAPVR